MSYGHWIEYDADTGVYRLDVAAAPYSLESRVLTSAIEEITGSDPGELPPLFDRVDADALDAIFASFQDGPDRDQGHVEFPYVDFRVTVEAEDRIILTPQAST